MQPLLLTSLATLIESLNSMAQKTHGSDLKMVLFTVSQSNHSLSKYNHSLSILTVI